MTDLSLGSSESNKSSPITCGNYLETSRYTPHTPTSQIIIDRGLNGYRSSHQFESSGTVHERHTRNATVWVFEGLYSDPWFAGCGSAEVLSIQRPGRRLSKSWYVSLLHFHAIRHAKPGCSQVSRNIQIGPRYRNFT